MEDLSTSLLRHYLGAIYNNLIESLEDIASYNNRSEEDLKKLVSRTKNNYLPYLKKLESSFEK